MRFSILVILIIFLSCDNHSSNKGKCDCLDELNFVIDYYEENLPAYQVDVNDNNRIVYENIKASIKKEAKDVNLHVDCFKTITSYVEYFNDNHSKIDMVTQSVDESNEQVVQDFLNSELFRSREVFNLDKIQIKQYPFDDIRGIYTHSSGNYKIAVIPRKSNFRDYVGVIIESKLLLWKPGQVKLEIKTNSKGNTAFLYLRNHGVKYFSRFPLNNGVLGDGWFKSSKKDKIDFSSDAKNEFFSTKLNDSIIYLRFPSFSNNHNAKIDSLYKASESLIENSKYVIVDLRNNGGGNDENAFPLLKYMYTNPIKTDVVDLYVTKSNIDKWQKWYNEALKDTINYKKEHIDWFNETIDQMKAATLNTFIKRYDGELIELTESEIETKKIAILYNRNTASSAETPLFWAMQSRNTILVGENSGGFTGYGEVDFIKTPCYDFSLYGTMTKYKEQVKYDAIGIKPDYQLKYNEDWIEQTITILITQ